MNNKRNIIICAVLAVLLLCGIGYLFHSLFFSSQADAVGTDRLTDGVEAVPSDAIFLLETGSFSDIMDMTDGGSALGRLAGSIPPEAGGWEAALSMLYVSKNTVSPLLVLSIPEKSGQALRSGDSAQGSCPGCVFRPFRAFSDSKSVPGSGGVIAQASGERYFHQGQSVLQRHTGSYLG